MAPDDMGSRVMNCPKHGSFLHLAIHPGDKLGYYCVHCDEVYPHGLSPEAEREERKKLNKPNSS